MDEKPDLYYCSNCQKNFKSLKCPSCNRKGVPAKVPFERDYAKDSSVLDFAMKKKAEEK